MVSADEIHVLVRDVCSESDCRDISGFVAIVHIVWYGIRFAEKHELLYRVAVFKVLEKHRFYLIGLELDGGECFDIEMQCVDCSWYIDRVRDECAM